MNALYCNQDNDDDDDDSDDDDDDNEISLEKLFDRHVPISHSNIAIILQLFDKILIANRGEIACRVCNIYLGACDLSLHFYYILSLYMNFLFSFIFRSWKRVNVLELKLLLSIVKQMQMLWVYYQNTFFPYSYVFICWIN